MPFQIIFIENDKRPDDSDRGARDARLLATREYETAQEANRAIERHKQWAADYGHTPGKMRIQRMVTAAWEEREAKRLEDGTYTPLPDWWINSWWWQDFNLKPIHPSISPTWLTSIRVRLRSRNRLRRERLISSL
jgi:hypothetical protein